LLNEVEVDPNSDNDTPCQYIELRGTPGSIVPANTFYVSIGGENAETGTVNETVDISGQVFGPNGTITIITDESISGGCPNRTYPAGTTVVRSFSFGGVAGLSAESFLIIRSPLGDPGIGNDIDALDDGIIDAAFQITVLDGIAFLTDGQGQRAYAPVVFSFLSPGAGPDTPDAATRPTANTTPLSAAWGWGELSTPEEGTLYVTPSNTAGNSITPGAPNVP
jgi:hypothetical protein